MRAAAIGPEAKVPVLRSPRHLLTLGLSLAVWPLLARAERAHRAMPLLPVQASTTTLPSLSVIVPARNEAQNLLRLLPSLERQIYAGEMEIIVVDDNSTDGTAETVGCRARSSRLAQNAGPGIRLVRAAALPAGWLGKPHASHTGACEARGQWLLFTDADTVHEPFSATSAVAFAKAHGLDGLSLFPQQETRGLLDGVVLMVAFAGFFAGMRRSGSMLNGQYVLVRREVYEASGGFAAVRAEMMEDLAFGRLLVEEGYRVPIMRGESVASVRMYDNWRHMWHGVNRLGSGSLHYHGVLALIPAILVTGVSMPLWTLIFNRRYLREIPYLPLIWLTAVAGIVPWTRKFRGKPGKDAVIGTALRALLAPVGAVFVQSSALWGMVSRFLGWGVLWKDRKV